MIYWLFFLNFESEKFSGETKNFLAKIKIGQAVLMNGQVFKSTFRTLNYISRWEEEEEGADEGFKLKL